jgi:Xaa-Pro aminopeptidase
LQKRLARARDMLQQKGLDAILVQSPVNRRYLSGFTGTAGTLLITGSKSILLTDFRYACQAERQCRGFMVTECREGLWDSLNSLVREYQVTKLGFEDDYFTYRQYMQMKEKMKGTEPVPLGEELNLLRAVKDREEMEIMRTAAIISEKALDHVLPMIRPGVTEREISKELEVFMIRAGCTGPAFDFIVASGWRSAMPHGVAADKRIEHGDFVTIDFGGKYEGYCSDMTRTFVVGRCSTRQREVYETVLAAQHASLEQIRARLRGCDADSTARSVIEKAGYGEYFGHGLGHGVGLEVHEAPVLGPRSEAVLEPGMAVTVEPGIYIEGFGGVRIEDLVIVTDDGVENLNSFPKELMVL